MISRLAITPARYMPDGETLEADKPDGERQQGRRVIEDSRHCAST